MEIQLIIRGSFFFLTTSKCSDKTATNITNIFAGTSTAISIKNNAVSMEGIGNFPQKVRREWFLIYLKSTGNSVLNSVNHIFFHSGILSRPPPTLGSITSKILTQIGSLRIPWTFPQAIHLSLWPNLRITVGRSFPSPALAVMLCTSPLLSGALTAVCWHRDLLCSCFLPGSSILPAV